MLLGAHLAGHGHRGLDARRDPRLRQPALPRATAPPTASPSRCCCRTSCAGTRRRGGALYAELLRAAGARRRARIRPAALAERLEELARARAACRAALRAAGVRGGRPPGARRATPREQWTGRFNPRPFDGPGALELYRGAFDLSRAGCSCAMPALPLPVSRSLRAASSPRRAPLPWPPPTPGRSSAATPRLTGVPAATLPAAEGRLDAGGGRRRSSRRRRSRAASSTWARARASCSRSISRRASGAGLRHRRGDRRVVALRGGRARLRRRPEGRRARGRRAPTARPPGPSRRKAQVKASPVVAAGKVLIGSYDQSRLRARRPDGQARLDASRPRARCTPPRPWTTGIAYVTGCDAILRALRVADGKELFQVSSGAYTGASPALAGGRAYYGTFENEVLGGRPRRAQGALALPRTPSGSSRSTRRPRWPDGKVRPGRPRQARPRARRRHRQGGLDVHHARARGLLAGRRRRARSTWPPATAASTCSTSPAATKLEEFDAGSPITASPAVVPGPRRHRHPGRPGHRARPEGLAEVPARSSPRSASASAPTRSPSAAPRRAPSAPPA